MSACTPSLHQVTATWKPWSLADFSAQPRHMRYASISGCCGSGMTKSMMLVVPPLKPAAVPVKKSSAAVVPMNGSCMCVCGSMPPGIT